MKLFLIWLSLVAVVVALAGICWLCLFLERKFPSKQYDERQLQARYKGYRFGFWVGIVYYFVAWVLTDILGKLADYSTELIFVGLMVQLLAGVIYMMLTGANLPLSQKPTPYLFALFFAVSGFSVINAYRSIRCEIGLYGEYQIPWKELVISVVWFALGVVYLISWLTRDRDE